VAAVLLDAWMDWACPNCNTHDRTRPLPSNAVRMHPCGGLKGLLAPLVPEGMDCKVVAVERQDYLGAEEQRTGDDGRPYSAVHRVRADGSNDALVFAPVAAARLVT
jgi:hypothetical protein